VNYNFKEFFRIFNYNNFCFYFSQLFYDGHSTIATSLSAQINADPPCCSSARLLSLVTIGLQYETDRQTVSEQEFNSNPIQQMLIGPGICMFHGLYVTYICVLYSLLDLIRLGI